MVGWGIILNEYDISMFILPHGKPQGACEILNGRTKLILQILYVKQQEGSLHCSLPDCDFVTVLTI
jgi:hypothetical protein